MKVYEEVEIRHCLEVSCRFALGERPLVIRRAGDWVAPELDLEAFLTVSGIETRFICFPNGIPVTELPCCYNPYVVFRTCSVLALFGS
jgi:hypothetical protein